MRAGQPFFLMRPATSPETSPETSSETQSETRLGSGPCEGPSSPSVPPRLVAGALLCVLAARFVPVLAHARQPLAQLPPLLFWMLAALSLGGCLWWVAKRQIGVSGGFLALALYVSSPLALSDAAATCAALGVFAMLYTGVGVAHALQGPRRKWPPRIALMASLCVFTSVAQPLACAAALALALIAMLYLAEQRRTVLPALFLLWTGAAALPWLLLRLLEHFLAFTLVLEQPEPGPLGLLRNAGLLGALAAALALWTVSRRSRYFGNTAPLLAAALLAAMTVVAGKQATLWAVPFVLLFVAGVIADGLESRSKKIWKLVVWLTLAAQCAASIRGFI